MNEAIDAIVLSDQNGRYYVVPMEALEESLVPDDAKAAVESDITDVSGFATNTPNFAFVGGLKLAPTRVRSTYGFRANGWPCDVPAGAWPCDTPQMGGQNVG